MQGLEVRWVARWVFPVAGCVASAFKQGINATFRDSPRGFLQGSHRHSVFVAESRQTWTKSRIEPVLSASANLAPGT